MVVFVFKYYQLGRILPFMIIQKSLLNIDILFGKLAMAADELCLGVGG